MEIVIDGGRILDTVVALGEFLSQAKQTNKWQCFETETSRYAVEFTKKEFDIELSFG